MKAIKLGVLVFFSIVWALGLSWYDTVYPYLYRWGIIQDEYRYGDLFNLAHLPQFKEEMFICEEPLNYQRRSSSRPIHLYLLGDSFTEPLRMDSSDFIADKYHYIKWGWHHRLHAKIDTNAINIVLIESVERHFRQHYENPPHVFFIPDTATFNVSIGTEKPMAKFDRFMQSSRAEDQLGLLLTSNRLGIKFKELKSSLNFRLFDRIESNVTLSNDQRHLVYYLDTDSLNFPITSGFSQISEGRIDSVVNSLNETRSRLLEMGFDHLVFSVIPNKSTVVMPDYGTYNRLIERVQTHPRLEVPYISVIDEYRSIGEKAYLRSDSHWTCEGRAIWIQKANSMLEQLIAGANDSGLTGEDCHAPGSRGLLLKNL